MWISVNAECVDLLMLLPESCNSISFLLMRSSLTPGLYKQIMAVNLVGKQKMSLYSLFNDSP